MQKWRLTEVKSLIQSHRTGKLNTSLHYLRAQFNVSSLGSLRIVNICFLMYFLFIDYLDMSGTILDAADILINKENRPLPLWNLHFVWGRAALTVSKWIGHVISGRGK